MSLCTYYKLFYWMQSLKPHTALLVVCLLGQKLGDDVSLSQLNAVSTLFLMGKFFIKPFSPKPRGIFCNILVILVVVPSQRPLLLSPLCPQASPRVMFDSTVQSFVVFFGECGGGSWSSRWLFPFPVNSQSLFGEGGWKHGFAESLAQIFWPGKARPARAFFFDIHQSLAGGLGDSSLNPKQFCLDYVKPIKFT